MSNYKTGLRGKILTLVLLALVGVSAFYSYQLYSFGTVSNGVLKNVVSDVDKVMKINNISVLFKSEVQAWKDLLIRGADRTNFEKYSHEMEEFSAKIETEIKAIQGDMTSKELSLTEEFLKTQKELTKSYKEAQSRFLKAGDFDMAAADSFVKGKDRPVLSSLSELSSILTEQMKKSSSATIQAGLRTSFLWALLIGCCMMVLSWFVVNQIVMIVLEIVKQLSQASEQVDVASQQLSNASQQIATGATEGAASLEETVASLEELSSMVKLNAENAQTAANISQDGKESAGRGEIEIRQLVNAMDTIAASSKKIEEIINVIDDIAFQTNILALNAAVEAARAGEQGKGFAVVAEAVRTLAQRSGDAAKEITTLIKDSTEKVNNGSKLANQSASVLNAIVTSIKKIADLNQEIASASQEQATGIGQINTAMNQLDQVTQSNASSAEESAAASEELSAQSKMLQETVNDLTKVIHGTDSSLTNTTTMSYNRTRLEPHRIDASKGHYTEKSQHSYMLQNKKGKVVQLQNWKGKPLTTGAEQGQQTADNNNSEAGEVVAIKNGNGGSKLISGF